MKSKLEYMIDIVKKTKYYKYLTNNEKSRFLVVERHLSVS